MPHWFSRFVPKPLITSPVEAARAGVGICLGLLLTGWVSSIGAGSVGAPLLIPPMGASAVLLFAMPASPLAQPWPILGGNIMAAFIGVFVAQHVPFLLPAAALATSCAFAAMSVARCLHPPSCAIAIIAVLGGAQIHAEGYGFVLYPVALNTTLLTLAAILYNNATRRSYPHRAHTMAHPHAPAPGLALTAADIEETMRDYGETMDISRDDLEKLFQELLARAQQRASAERASAERVRVK